VTCYRVNWKVTEAELDQIMPWLVENKVDLGCIRHTAWEGFDRGDGRCWYTKFVFTTEDGVRSFYRRWCKGYQDDWTFAPWR
jgi:hypothetical protein